MKRTPLAALLLALLLVAGSWIAWRGDGASAPLVTPQGAIPAEPAEVGEEVRERAALLPTAAPAREVLDAVDVPADEDSHAASSALLDVLVVRADDGEPVPGVRVTCSPFGAPGRIVEHPWETTDDQGRAQLTAPTGTELRVRTDADPAYAQASERLAALLEGERREVRLRLRFPTQRSFHGRVVDARDGRPIEGARIVGAPASELFAGPATEERDVGATAATTDADGRFLIEEQSLGPGSFEVRLEGFARLRFQTTDGHATLERTRELHLSRVARLIVRVADAGGEPVGVGLTVPGYTTKAGDEGWHFPPDLSWNATVEPDQAATLDDLFPGAPLSVELRRGGRLARSMPDALSLEPGETREVTWSLGGSRLRGRVLHEDHSPLAEAPVLLILREEPPGIERRVLDASSARGRYVIARTRTDASGHFALEDVAPGRYWIGPDPPDKGGAPDWLPLAEAVEIGAERADELVEIVLPRALYIGGQVLGLDGEPAPSIYLLATTSLRGFVTGNADSEGRFRLGPLPAGECRVSTPASRGATLEPVSVPAGTLDLVIQLTATGRVAGRIIDGATGELQGGLCHYSGSESSSFGGTSSPGGTFEFMLTPGTYALTATATGARIGVLHPVVVDPDAPIEDLVLRLEPGGQVRVRYRGSTSWSYFRIRWNGQTIATDGLRSGTESLKTVPAGEVEVEFHIGSELVESRLVTVAAGELVDVDFEL